MLQLWQGAAVCGIDGNQLLRPGKIHGICVFLDRLFQLCFHLCLGLAQDAFVDCLSGFRIPPGGVASLPSTIAAFSDIAFTIGSAFCHSYRPHSATQHTIALVQ